MTRSEARAARVWKSPSVQVPAERAAQTGTTGRPASRAARQKRCLSAIQRESSRNERTRRGSRCHLRR